MKRYFVELGPVHKRVFLNHPPAHPLGPIMEISEENWEHIERVHPSQWRVEDAKITYSLDLQGIVAKLPPRHVIVRQSIPLLLAGGLAGLIVGILIGLCF